MPGAIWGPSIVEVCTATPENTSPMVFGPLTELLADQDGVTNRLLAGDRMEGKRVLSVFAVLDEKTILDHGEPVGRIYGVLGREEQACLRACRSVWMLFEPHA
jgi:hypothetical protein